MKLTSKNVVGFIIIELLMIFAAALSVFTPDSVVNPLHYFVLYNVIFWVIVFIKNNAEKKNETHKN